MPPSSSILIAFYEGTGKDTYGRYLSQILQWDEKPLENSHNYIQTLFPLPEGSRFVITPLLDQNLFKAFRERPELRNRLRDAFKKMLWFYGLVLITDDEGHLAVTGGPNWAANSQHWYTRSDHNHLRISRIIRSLRILGLEEEALKFYDVVSAAEVVSATSRQFWARSALRPLNVPPDLEDALIRRTTGAKFLRDYEEALKKGGPNLRESEEDEDDDSSDEDDESEEEEEEEEEDDFADRDDGEDDERRSKRMKST